MISFALKQAWFWLALVGLVQCWITLIIFPGLNFGGLWGRLYYCIFVTLLEGMFCLGLIWHMDPQRMPRAFCIAQVISFSLASYALTGLCACFAVASALAMFRPASFNSGKAVLAWRTRYTPLVIFFPIAACITHSTLLVTLDAVQPSRSDDLHCDATNPIWMRLVGYAGVPLVVSIPFLVLSILTASRLFRVWRSCPADLTSSNDPDGEEPTSTAIKSINLHDGRRRNRAFRLTAFLPYPTKALLNGSTAAMPESSGRSSQNQGRSGEEHDYPLHHHPFPPIDPLTGKAYSPSLEERDATSFAFMTPPMPTANVNAPASAQLQSLSEPRLTSRSQNLSAPSRDGRGDSSTPDSGFSSSMPVFASNPSLPVKPVLTQASGVSIHSQNSRGGSDVQIGLAITTDDSPKESKLKDPLYGEEGEMIGLAVTTDEPDRRTLTPSSRPGTSSPQSRSVRASSSVSDIHTVHGTPQPQAQRNGHPFAPNSDFGLGLVMGDRSRSSESITRTLPSPQHPLHHLVHSNHSAPHGLSSPGTSVSHKPHHHRQSSFVSSATVYSAPYPLLDREEQDLLPFSPASASSFQSPPMTPKDMGIDAILDLGTRIQTGHQNHHDDQKGDIEMDWDDEYDYGVGVPVRTVKPRDPRERLGVYNPTPPTPTSMIFERQRRKLQRKQELVERGTNKLRGAIWRMVLFQIAFFVVQLLASLSSILDVAHNQVTPFGTQHVALLLAAWGPLCIFGHLPSNYRFWRRWQ